MREAAYYERLEGGAVRCALCPHGCKISEGKKGRCGVRVTRDGALWAESYGRVTSMALDPIEKKPLNRFYPGSFILSVGSYGCNLCCPFCQNHGIASGEAPWEACTPEEVAKASLELAERGNIGVAYTYNEPMAGYEFVYDCAVLIRAQNQKNVLVTNGYIEEAPLRALLPLIDAMNIDLKCFSDTVYGELGGRLSPVQRTIRLAAAQCHVELTTLIVPGKNDAPEEMDALSRWVSGIDKNIPLHVSKFFPRHKMTDMPPTPVESVYHLADIARRHLRYVYTGNC